MVDLANYVDGKSAAIVVVTIEIRNEKLVIAKQDGPELARWPLDNVRYVSLPSDGGGRRLRCGFDQSDRLTLTSAFVPDWIIDNCPNLKRTQPGFRRYWKKVALWGGGAAASLAFILLVAIPLLAKQFAGIIPEDVERRIGDGMIEHFGTALSDDKDQPYCAKNLGYINLNNAVNSLSTNIPGGRNIQFHILDTKMANAFALPGGHIVMTRGLIEDSKSANELIGVLAHEIGHVEARHPLQGALESAGFSLVLGLVIGDVTGGFILANLTDAMLDNAFSRDMEREADAIGVKLMNAQNFDTRPLGELLKRISGDTGATTTMSQYFSSHPASGDRAAYIDEHATGRLNAMTDDDWQQVKDTTCQ